MFVRWKYLPQAHSRYTQPRFDMSSRVIHSNALTADALSAEVLTAAWPSCSPPADGPNSPAPTETSMMMVSAAERARPTHKQRAPLAARRPLDAPPPACVLNVL